MGSQQDVNNEIEIDLKELVLEVLSYWKVILVAMVLAGAIGFGVSEFLITPQYQSTSELYVLSTSTTITSLADIQMGSSLTNDYMVVVKGRAVLDQVIKNLGLDENYDSLSAKVSLSNPTNSRCLLITVTDEDPYRAKAIADEIATVGSEFIQVKMMQDKPTIIQNGYADGKPISPNILKNTILAAVVGCLVTIIIIVIAYLLNDTIMGPEDIEKKLGLNVLGTLPLEEADDENNKRGNKAKKKKK
jgi:capsular polysaccharide biosynthesis protein